MRDEVVHALQHFSFVSFGADVWMWLFGPLPKPAWFGNGAAQVYILGVRLVGAGLANVLLFGGGAFYDVYAVGSWLRHRSRAPTRSPPAR